MKQKRELKKAEYLYGDYYKKSINTINTLLKYYKKKNLKIAIWGGGLKGIAFLKIFDPYFEYIENAFDNNEQKWGSRMPTKHPIASINNASFCEIEVILLMNNNYETEVAAQLIENEKNVVLFNIDSIILGNLTFEECIQMYGRKIIM